MKITKYLNKNKVGGIILIIVIIIAFGLGGFGGGFISNNQNNIAKINKTNVTTEDFISYVNQSNISQQAIKDNLNNNVIEELLSSLVSTKLLNLEIKDFDIKISESILSKKIKLNKNFIDENGIFQRIKYEKFLLENNLSAPAFEHRLKERELQKRLFDLIGAGTVSPNFLIAKLFKNENREIELDFIDLENFYKKNNEFNDQDLIEFVNENNEQLKVEYIDFKYAIINPQNLIGINEFNQTFFDKIDEIENSILNGVKFNKIILEFNLNVNVKNNYKYSDESNEIERKIFEVRDGNFDIFENGDDFIIYKIDSMQKKRPDLSDEKTKNEILKLVIQKNKFDYNKKLLDKIKNKEFDDSDFFKFGNDSIKNLTLNSIKDNKKFEINSVKLLYSLPSGTFTLIGDKDDKVYLAKIKKYNDAILKENSEDFRLYITKENTNIRQSILKSYDFLLIDKYKVNVSQKAIDNVKNLFQ